MILNNTQNICNLTVDVIRRYLVGGGVYGKLYFVRMHMHVCMYLPTRATIELDRDFLFCRQLCVRCVKYVCMHSYHRCMCSIPMSSLMGKLGIGALKLKVKYLNLDFSQRGSSLLRYKIKRHT